MEIEDHALIYALLCKNIIEQRSDGEDIIRELTQAYGIRRGMRMANHALSGGDELNLNSFFIYGEWKGKEGENISTMEYNAQDTVSRVRKCCWYDTWRKYDLVEYGSHYCRYIDQALCDGFNGEFALDVEGILPEGERDCVFRWNTGADQKLIEDRKKQNGGKYIRDFTYHTDELIQCAREILDDDELVNDTLEEYRIMKGDHDESDKVS